MTRSRSNLRGALASLRRIDQRTRDERVLLATRLAVAGILLLAVLQAAWIADDALITLRSALNLTHGFGPGYNTDESVQAYTHPSWFLAWSALGALTNQWIGGIMLLGAACSFAAVLVALRRAETVTVVIAAGISLGLSTAFVEYATSGLENSLAYLIFGALFACATRWYSGDARHRTILLVGLLVAALALTRWDLLLLVAAPLIYISAIRIRATSSWREPTLAIGAMALPLLTWCAWALTTYGSILPNTFLAKRNLDIEQSELIQQGLKYVFVTSLHDPVTVVVLAGVTGWVAASGTWHTRAWSFGILTYLAYVVWIAGDFMVGRFFAVPLYAAVVVGIEMTRERQPRPSVERRRERTSASVVLVLGLVLLLLRPAPIVAELPSTESGAPPKSAFLRAGVADERSFWVRKTGSSMWALGHSGDAAFRTEANRCSDANSVTQCTLADVDRWARNWPSRQEIADPPIRPTDVFVRGGLGQLGISTGPVTHWIDPYGLTDRFVAGIPFSPGDDGWRVGHYKRNLPEGYERAVASRDPSELKDTDLEMVLSDLWEKIRR
jgi:arabinofuranosyltransferase